MIKLTEPFLPNIKKYNRYIEKIYERKWLTNNGPLSLELEHRLKDFLGIDYLVLTNNGTVSLNLLYHLYGISKEIITTPFSFIATTSSVLWDGIDISFNDIEMNSFNLDPSLLEKNLSANTQMILPVHVFGEACKVEEIDEIGKKHGVKIVYDAAHAFGTKVKGKSALLFGDASILSFHATKLFHTIEGGGIIVHKKDDYERLKSLVNFGIEKEGILSVGTNAKMNEFSAAMGLCVLDEVDNILSYREELSLLYRKELDSIVDLQECNSTNYSYMPVVFKSERELLKVERELSYRGIGSRRYFYPSLNKLPFISTNQSCPNSESVASRILTLPLGMHISRKDVVDVVSCIKGVL